MKNSSVNANSNSFRRKKLIEDTKPQRDAQRSMQAQTEAVKQQTQVSEEQVQYQQDLLAATELQTDVLNDGVQNVQAAQELSLDELNSINQAVKENTSTASSVLRVLDIIQKELEKTVQQDEAPSWLKLITDKPVPQGVNVPAPSNPVIKLPPPPEVEETKNEKMLPEKKDADKERGKSTVIESLFSQLKSINSSLTGMAGSLTQLVFQIGLQTVKLAAMGAALLFGTDMIISVIQTAWQKYGDQIKSVFEGVKESIVSAWDGVKDMLPIEEMKRVFSNLGNLFQDFQNGELIDGLVYTFKDQMQNIVSVVSRVFEACPKFRNR